MTISPARSTTCRCCRLGSAWRAPIRKWYGGCGRKRKAAYLVFGMRPNAEVGRIDSDVPKALGLELQLIDDERAADAKVEPSHGGDAWYRNIN